MYLSCSTGTFTTFTLSSYLITYYTTFVGTAYGLSIVTGTCTTSVLLYSYGIYFLYGMPCCRLTAKWEVSATTTAFSCFNGTPVVRVLWVNTGFSTMTPTSQTRADGLNNDIISSTLIPSKAWVLNSYRIPDSNYKSILWSLLILLSYSIKAFTRTLKYNIFCLSDLL